jgi:Flp pilus assembly protein TadG
MNPVRRRKKGMTLIYTMFAMVAFVALCSLSVDVARVQNVRAALQTAADAAARNGCLSLPNGQTAVRSAAAATAAANYAGGSTVVLNTGRDVHVGVWNSGTKTFTATTTSPNAVRVIAARTGADGNATQLLFASLIGKSTCDLTVTSIAILNGTGTTTRVEGIQNPWLGGMPNGTYGGASNTGTAPLNSPVTVPGLTLTAGQVLNFAVAGTASDDPININYGWSPDGHPGGLRTNDTGYLHGMANMRAQQASLTGVFLTNNQPNTEGAAPAMLDFSTTTAMDYTSLSPRLRQPFFIGDGRTSSGVLQSIVVPAGATRLILGLHDNVNWNNNSGFFIVSVGNGTRPRVQTVR